MHEEILKNLAEWRDHFIAQTHPAALTLMAAIKTITAENSTRLNAEKVTMDALAKRDQAEADRDQARAERDDADDYIRAIWKRDLLPTPMPNRLFDRLTKR